MAHQGMTVEQLHEYVRNQEKDNMRSQYQASFNQGKAERKYRPQTAGADKLRQTAERFSKIHPARNDYGQNRNANQGQRHTTMDQESQYSRHARSNASSQQNGYCPKHGPIPKTVQHTSGKAAAYLSPQPSRPQSGATSHAKMQQEEGVRGMVTNKFLHTDMKEYLAKDEHVTCISCQHCVRMKDKLLHYKYNRGIQSSYGANFQNSSGHKKQTVFNLDQERRQLKVPYKPPRTFVTTNGVNMIDSKGTGMIGAMTKEGKGYFRNSAPKGETEDDVKRAFVNNTSNQLTYPVYGKLPEANKRPSKPFAPGYGKVDAISAYQMTYQNATDDKYRETAKLEKARVKAYQRQQVRGTLNPAVPLPFKGQSTAQKEFINRKKERVEKVLPFNMLVVPHGMSMHTKSEAQSMFDAKPIRKLH